MLKSVFVPTPSAIENWKNIDTIPIVGTAPRCVPLSVFVRYPAETVFDLVLPARAGLQATEVIALIQLVSQNVKDADDLLSELYSKRSISKPIYTYMEKLGQFSQNMKSAVISILTPQIDFLSKIQLSTTSMIENITLVFKNDDIWNNGKYNDQLLDQISILIYKLTSLEQLLISKSLINDISRLLKLINDQEFASSTQKLRIWALTKNVLTSQLIDKMKDLDENRFITLFKIFIDYIRLRIEDDDFIYPDMQFVYVNMYIFLIRFYQAQEQNEKNKLKDAKKPKPVLGDIDIETKFFLSTLIKFYPTLPLYFDNSILTIDNTPKEFLVNISNKNQNVSNLPKINPVPLYNLIEIIRIEFSNLSAAVLQANSHSPRYERSKHLSETLIKVLHLVSTCLNRVRQILSKHLLKVPPAPDTEAGQKMSKYELSMKIGLKDDLTKILLTLCLCRTIKELIITNLATITENVSYYIQSYFQNFAHNKLPPACIRSEKNPDQKKIFETLRTLIGSFEKDEFVIKDQIKKYGNITPKVPKCPPQASIAELARIQLQMVANPYLSSKKNVLKTAKLSNDDKKEIDEFLKDTRYFIELLLLPTTIEVVFDQSNLFFKEFYLDLYDVSFFPVTASLPVILSEYALRNYHKVDLTYALFYPLSIYDDAAQTALHSLHSKMLYDEIKAEAEICLAAIMRTIADSSFHPIRRFITISSLSRTMLDNLNLKVEAAKVLKQSSSAVRIGTLLEQNQLTLLGCSIDTKSLIAERVDSLIYKAIEQAIDFFRSHGVLVSIAVKRILDVLRSTHSFFLEHNIPTMPFDDMLSIVMSTDTPNSLQSKVFFYIVDHLQNTVIYDYYLLTTPFRLIPKKQPKIQFYDSAYKDGSEFLQKVLLPTTSMITIENFRELFWLLNDGSIVLLQQQLLLEMDEILQNFCSLYASIQKRLRRIKNAPLSSNCVEVFELFEGAYRYFVDDDEVNQLFGIMAQIGNIFAISEMMDDAFILKKSSIDQYTSFIFNKTADDGNTDISSNEVFQIFEDKAIGRHFRNYSKLPAENEVIQPFLYNALFTFSDRLSSQQGASDMLAETSQYYLDLQTLTGFASTWSVLEFLFVLRESMSEKHEQDFTFIGEGVQLCAAAILCMSKQIGLYDILCISNIIKAHRLTDFNVLKDQRVKTFLSLSDSFIASLRCAITSYLPIYEHIYNS